jgi:deoxyribose-phosphate aldolase
MSSLNRAARTALPLLDLTRLETEDSEQPIVDLCRRARTPHGNVAAICVCPRFVALARRTLDKIDANEVRVATVVNFPEGAAAPEEVARDIARALVEGADEIDAVLPWRALQSGDESSASALLIAARNACHDHPLKVILETGELATPERIRRAADIAIECGADFLKTSTGKVPISATPEAARILLEAIRDSGRDVGCKVSGGIRTTVQAREYLELATEIMGAEWIAPVHFRFGASSLLDDLLETLGGTAAMHDRSGSY